MAALFVLSFMDVAFCTPMLFSKGKMRLDKINGSVMNSPFMLFRLIYVKSRKRPSSRLNPQWRIRSQTSGRWCGKMM